MNITVSKSINFVFILVNLCVLLACDNEYPDREDTPELVTKVALTFTPTEGGLNVVGTAIDPDGEGIQSLKVNGPINLSTNKTYLLTISLINELAQPGDPEYTISSEIEREGDEHIFFFSWTNNIFGNPDGDGNIDNRTDPVNYTGGFGSKDVNNLPLGLTTTWTMTSTIQSGSFRVLLKHQPGIKSNTSDSNVGETDLDITFPIDIR